ncbi:MAG: PadR family transcriptional regulator [Gemmatimonadetes bacterium]|nr:PadR family transcriptional regulator [Gemmatimonadota bacterium]
MTGYDLKKAMDSSTQSFWHARLSQIYPTLKALEADGLITSRVEDQVGKPARRVYRIGPRGREALVSWLVEPVERAEPGKSTALLKLFFSGSLERDDILRHLRAQLAARRAELARLREEVKPRLAAAVKSSGLEREGMMWELVRELGERVQGTYVEWLEYAIDEVERRG